MGKPHQVQEFIAVTGSDEETAKQMLEAFSGNLEAAVSSFLDCPIPPQNPVLPRSPDHVRAPIPQTKGVLVEDVDPNPVDGWMMRNRPRSVFDGFRNFKAEEDSNTSGSKKLKRLEDLFRPPLDLMHKGTFQTAKAEGTMLHKWLIVNVQNVREFACQVLNRDVWSEGRVKALVKENFIFWQVYSDSSEGERFMTFYKVGDWPNISILDPRTGARVAVFKDFTKEAVISQLLDFVDNHGTLEDEVQPPSKKRKVENEQEKIWDTSEDAQMAAAIAASLRESTEQRCVDVNSESESQSDGQSSDSPEEVEKEKNSGLNSKPHSCSAAAAVESSKSCANGKNGEQHTQNTEQSKTVTEPSSQGKSSSPPRKKLVKIFPKRSPNTRPFENRLDARSRFDAFERTPSATPRTAFNQTPFENSPKSNASAPGKCCLMLRLPDGAREKLVMQENDTIGDLQHFLSLKKLGAEKLEFLTNFPQRILSSMDPSTTLKEAGLKSQETVFVRETL